MRRMTSGLILSLVLWLNAMGQEAAVPQPGPRDTLMVQAIYYNGEWMPYGQMEEVFVSNLPPQKLAKYIEGYNRLKRAVYTTYPYARSASNVINDVNARLKDIASKKQRKKYIKSREGELKKQFGDPLSNLSVYQGRVLMKLIYRETGNDCYEIIKEYKGGLNARMYQTVAFFFGGNLKQEFDPLHDPTDRQIESILRNWYGARYASIAFDSRRRH